MSMLSRLTSICGSAPARLGESGWTYESRTNSRHEDPATYATAVALTVVPVSSGYDIDSDDARTTRRTRKTVKISTSVLGSTPKIDDRLKDTDGTYWIITEQPRVGHGVAELDIEATDMIFRGRARGRA